MYRVNLTIVFLFLTGCASVGQPRASDRSRSVSVTSLESLRNPNLRFRIDSFSVPAVARPEFEATMERNLEFIRTLPGFHGHLLFEKAGGPTTFDIVTVAVWDSEAALERAGERVRAHYREIGLDLPATLSRWGVRAELGNFRALQPESGQPPGR